MAKKVTRRFTVTMGQGWKEELPRILRDIGASRIGPWSYTDGTSTEIAVSCSFAGSADDLQSAIWDGGAGMASVGVEELRHANWTTRRTS